MNDFITFSCPSCGGPLKIETTSTTYTCDYCGQQHRVRIEDIESHGRCPICKRNDKTEKVSAIYNNKYDLSRLASRIHPPFEPSINENNDIYLTDSLNLKKLTLKETVEIFPNNFVNDGYVILFASLFFLTIFLIEIFASAISALMLLIPIGGVLLSALIIKNGKKEYSALVEKNKILENENIQLKNNWNITAQALHDKWKSAYRKWEQCYYCHRDDVIFIPSENIPVTPLELIDYLYKDDSD